MKSKEIIIKENKQSIAFYDFEPVILEKLPPSEFNIDDIKITAFNRSEIYKGFADYSAESVANNKPVFNPLVTSIVNLKPKPFCVIIGLWEVLFIDFQRKVSKLILKLNRKKSDDGGFYYLKILTLPNAFLFIYESGIARISENGKVEWHNSLYWDDVYCKTDDFYIYYSSEYRENEDWRVRIKDGEIIEDWT